MGLSKIIWSKPAEYIARNQPLNPVMFFAPGILQSSARRFVDGFPGLVSYAIKANSADAVIENLAAAGVRAFAVASIAEMEQIHRLAPAAAMHHNNPIRARHEIEAAVRFGVKSYAIDSRSELAKLIELVPPGSVEIAVRFRLPSAQAPKFGASEPLAAELLAEVAAAGYRPALAFHPGTQCTDGAIWQAAILMAGHIARKSGVPIGRLNVGGGFPSHRLTGEKPDNKALFALISETVAEVFGESPPALVCEPGRAIVAECFALAARVNAIRDDEDVFLNDGTYGTLDEMPVIGVTDRARAIDPQGEWRKGAPRLRQIFGPTCDRIDRLPGALPLPADLAEGDYLIFHGMGAYSLATNTRFNGYGDLTLETVLLLH